MEIVEISIPDQPRCFKCGVLFRGCVGPEGFELGDGDPYVCSNCGAILVFDGNGGFRDPEEDVVRFLMGDPDIAAGIARIRRWYENERTVGGWGRSVRAAKRR